MLVILRNAIIAAVALIVAASNVIWPWTNDYLACFLAVVAGGIAGLLYERFADGLYGRKLKDMYGQDWE